MMQLKLVKTAEEQLTHQVDDEETELLHKIRVLLFSISPWYYTICIVVGGSYFASVGTAEQLSLKRLGLLEW